MRYNMVEDKEPRGSRPPLLHLREKEKDPIKLFRMYHDETIKGYPNIGDDMNEGSTKKARVKT